MKKYHPKKHRNKFKKIFLLVTIFIIILLISNYLFKSISPTIVAFSEAKIRSLTMSAINSAIFNVMSEPLTYGELIRIIKNDSGEITLIEANSIVINKLARDMAQATETYIEKIGEQDVEIPIGTLSGSTLLAGKGFNVTIKILPLGSVKCQFISEFESAGINQTRHKIYLDVIASISIVLPTSESMLKINTPVLVSESIIIGKVPETYLSAGSIFGEDYDLTP